MARYQAGIKTRERILDAVRTLLGEVGLDSVTVKGICDQAEIKSGSFYNLFDSKEQAVLTVVREAITGIDPDPLHEGKDTIGELVSAYIAFVEDTPEIAKTYVQIVAASSVNDETIRHRVLAHHRARVDRFAEALARAQNSVSGTEIHARAEMLVAALNGLAFMWLLEDDFDFGGHATRLLGDIVPA
ncbi:MAG: TetR/AcrR family transcriptional regulator [Acidimicrobiia bacterium]|nr:TetR/AcrR family transcriptional regulator [Acidimicrobiia bacterium]NNF65204.1 TetR/AcrR family transcriptional regulator [Acidimicrobiia bacterium]